MNVRYRRLEARRLAVRPAIAVAVFAVVSIAGTHLLLPLFPELVIDFLRQAFRLDDFGGVLLINDLLATLFVVFLAGLVGLFAAVVGPRENHELELLLAKPIPASEWLAARTRPVLLASALVGVVSSLAIVAAMALTAPADTSVSLAGAFGASLALTALALIELALLEVLLVRVSDSFHALAVAFAVWFVPVIPTATFIYRPDAFDSVPGLTAFIVLSGLVWHDDEMTILGPILALVAAIACVALGRLAGWRLERADL